MKKRILIFNANPGKESFCAELSRKYYEGAKQSGADAELINLIDLKFDLILRNGYKKDQKVENDIKNIREKIKNSNHLVFVFPNWWGTYPALLKGFVDRVFVPEFAFRYRKNSLMWDKLLKEKTARLIVTMDTPRWYYSLFYKSPGINSFKKSVLKFCGISPVKTTIFSSIKKSTDKQRSYWLKYAKRLGFGEK